MTKIDLQPQFWIDVGGTFTDCIARLNSGELRMCKVLSSGVTKGRIGAGSTRLAIFDESRSKDVSGFWRGFTFQLLDAQGQVVAQSCVAEFDAAAHAIALASPLEVWPQPGQAYELLAPFEAPILAIRSLLGLPPEKTIPPCLVRCGTTRGTNALLTRRGARTTFVTTKGFADALRIGYQNRPKLFELAIHKPQPLFERVIEIEERLAADGEVLLPLRVEQAREALRAAKEAGAESLAICLLHAYVKPDHEKIVESLAREVGFREVSVSHEVSPFIKLVARGDTTVVDAYLNPVLRDYVGRLQAGLPGSQLRMMTSAGSLVSPERFTGKESVLSGPAGGAVGAARVAEAAGFARAIGFDMGGTSTDVCRYDARLELNYEQEQAGVRMVTPMLAVETVAAGGGSICRFDGMKLVVGPESAGADPGPACYGRGGPLTVTDLNFYLNRLAPAHFPFALDRAAVERRLGGLQTELETATGRRLPLEELALGCLRIANANMARAIRSVSLAKGYDPRNYVLVAFGGAAGQHACDVADELGMRQVLIHPQASALSALGIGLADLTRRRAAPVYQTWSRDLIPELQSLWTRLTAEATAELIAEGAKQEQVLVRRALDVRYRGTDQALTLPLEKDGEPTAEFDPAGEFAAAHQRLYGYVHRDRSLEVVAVRVEATAKTSRIPPRPVSPKLVPGQELVGPDLIVDPFTVVVVRPGWSATGLPGGELLLTRNDGASSHSKVSHADLAVPDPILLEVFNNLFTGIAEQMGITLRNTSSSVNVKERLDFSCALFTAAGDLVVNAPHIPVHLGAMAATVKRVLSDNPDLAAGDVFVTNDPYRGGSHLPDVTVVTPVFEEGRLLFFTASRAHHAEIGGITPGSMPPFSRNLEEEGVLLRNLRIVERGQPRLEAVRAALLAGRYPSRAVEDNLADLSAQIAANAQGACELRRLIKQYGLPVVETYMLHIQTAAEQKMRRALAKLQPGRRTFVDHLDDGTPIKVAIEVAPIATAGDQVLLDLDFTGTGPVSPGNLNANRAIVTAAVMYVLRLLIDEDIPLNQGVLAPVRITLPECILNPPEGDAPQQSAAVVGGNVETSQRVVDVLLGAFGLAAASQGTMNNVLFGDDRFGYYETICGGSGATPDADGADAVQIHMTNTRATDPEVLEQRYPVRLLEFAIRRGSGGRGRHSGGDGVIRRIQFLRPLRLSLLTQRRGPYPPFGIAGGEPGALGCNWLERAGGATELLPSLAVVDVKPEDCLIIETPGGGGFGGGIGRPAT
jgi:5-oxoprolinase (ATP-hydrolysing)